MPLLPVLTRLSAISRIAPICLYLKMQIMYISVKIIQFTEPSSGLPEYKGKTLVADQSSCFLSEPVDVTKYGLIFGGAQKNVGPAGAVIVIIREDLITDDVLPGTPTMLRYKTHADAESLYNTPPPTVFTCAARYLSGLKQEGGLEAMKKINEKKAKILYDFLDESKLFQGNSCKRRPFTYERSFCHRR